MYCDSCKSVIKESETFVIYSSSFFIVQFSPNSSGSVLRQHTICRKCGHTLAQLVESMFPPVPKDITEPIIP